MYLQAQYALFGVKSNFFWKGINNSSHHQGCIWILWCWGFAPLRCIIWLLDCNLLKETACSVSRKGKWRGGFGNLHSKEFNSRISVTSGNNAIPHSSKAIYAERKRHLNAKSVASKNLPLKLHFNLISEIIAKLRVSILNIFPPTKEIPQEWEAAPVYRQNYCWLQ